MSTVPAASQSAVRASTAEPGAAAREAQGGVAKAAHGAVVHEPVARRLQRLLRLPADRQRIPVVHALRPAVESGLDRAGQLQVPVRRRRRGMACRVQHALVPRHRRAAAGAVRVRDRGHDQPRAGRRRNLQDDLLPPDAGADGRRHARVRVPVQPGHGAGQHAAGEDRDHGAAVVSVVAVGEAIADPVEPVGGRQRDGDLPGGDPRRPQAPPRGRRARRGRPAAPAVVRDAADDQPGDPVLDRDRRDRGAAVLRPGVRREHGRAARGGRRRRRQLDHARIPGRLDAVLPAAPLSAGLPLLQHGLRGGAVDAAAGRLTRGHAARAAQLEAAGSTRRRRAGNGDRVGGARSGRPPYGPARGPT